MKTVLSKCTAEDFSYISAVLESYASFTNDKRRRKLLSEYQNNSVIHLELISLIDTQINTLVLQN